MDGTYYVIKIKATGEAITPSGVGKVPHLYATKGKAEGRLKSMIGHWHDKCEIVPVRLTELKQGEQA